MTPVLVPYSSATGRPVIEWLQTQLGADVVTLTLDLGQGGDLVALRETALSAGAVRAHVIDAREEFARDCVLPSIQANARREDGAPLVRELGTAAIARRIVEVAEMERALTVACPEAGGDSLARLEASIRSLDSRLVVTAPRIDAAPDAPGDARVRANLWGRTIVGGASPRPPAALFILTRSAADCPEEPALVDLDFHCGVPVRANGIEMSLPELIESLEIIAGAHGVGRFERVAPRKRPTAEFEACEAPAAAVLHEAHQALQAAVIDDELRSRLGEAARSMVGLLERGQWFTPAREAVDSLLSAARQRVSGKVTLELWKGTIRSKTHPDGGRGESSGASLVGTVRG